MYYKFSRLAKFAIIFSITLTALVVLLHAYNIHRYIETNNLIFDKMDEMNVLRETAIRYLENEGIELLIGGEFSAAAGIIFGILTLFSLYKYSKENSFAFAIISSFLCLLTSFISGLLLFYVILSGKSEIPVEIDEREFKNQWESFISQKSRENINTKKME